MRATRNSKAREKQQQSDRDLAEEALDLVIKNAPLDSETIKALRLTCKRTKTAADARVKDLLIFAKGDTFDQEPEAVRRSGLLNNITTLEIALGLEASNDESQNSLRLSRALGLLTLAVGVCKSIKALHVGISGPSQLILDFACLLGNCVWETLESLSMLECFSMPGFLAGMLARPGSLPALKELRWQDPSAADVEALSDSELISTLTFLSIAWSSAAYESNTAPAMVAAMRNLLQKASKVESLHLISETFDFFECENLLSLIVLQLETPESDEGTERDEVDFAPALARPWTKLENLSITYAYLPESDLVRIFEAEDTLPVLKELIFKSSYFDLDDALTCVRRPHLKILRLGYCSNAHALLLRLAQLMKDDTSALPNLRVFFINCYGEEPIDAVVEALIEFFSCPSMASLEELSIYFAQMKGNYAPLLCKLADSFPNLKYLNLRCNQLGRPAVALLHGLGSMGAFPQLKELVILGGNTDIEAANKFDIEHPHMPPLDVQANLQRVWPGLKCS